MKRDWIIATFLFGLLPTFAGTPTQGYTMADDTADLDIIVIDAGHGGKDSGCLGQKAKEKNVALSIALKTGKMIEEKYPEVKVIYTRDSDVFIPLDERANIANSNKADLFISIHCNAVATNKEGAYGTETYTMGMHVKESNLEVAKRENEAILYEENYIDKYDGFDPNSPQGYILLSMYQNAYITQSLNFADKVERAFETAKRKSRGVHQAGFLVLRKTAMPAVLIETGYLTNSTEEKFLASDEGQATITESIVSAFGKYRDDIYKKKGITPPAAKSVKPTTPAKPTTVEDEEEVPKVEIMKPSSQTKIKVTQQSPTPVQTKDKKPLAATAPEETSPEPVEAVAQSIGGPEIKVSVSDPKPAKEQVSFHIQLAASPKSLNTKKGELASIKGLVVEKSQDKYTYLSPATGDYYEALTQQDYYRKNGFKDAFMVPYKDGKRISVTEAWQELGIKH